MVVKFIQIAAVSSGEYMCESLYALDEHGRVWVHDCGTPAHIHGTVQVAAVKAHWKPIEGDSDRSLTDE